MLTESVLVCTCMYYPMSTLIFISVAAGAIYSNCSDGDLRLSGGETEYQGRVEICINNLWGSICYSSSRYGNYWNVDDGRVVCRALGHQELGNTAIIATIIILTEIFSL